METDEDRLAALVTADERLGAVLAAVRDADLPNWAVTSGVIRNLVWDHLHGYPTPSPVKDVDVAFFDPTDLSRDRDRAIEADLARRLPAVPWDVANQAGVHLWYADKFGHSMDPITSLEDGIGRYPETATSVGVGLDHDGRVTVIAPRGLDDLWGMVLRRNPRQVSRELFRKRLEDKRITERWPLVTVIDD